MSWHYLQAREAASWEGISLDGAPDALLSLIPTPVPCCSPDNATDVFRDSQYGTTCERSTVTRGAVPSTSSPADSHARTSAPPGKASASPESGPAFGSPWRESSARYDLATHGWRTHQCLWDEALPWSSVTLPKWGMMRDGVLWERTTPVPPISGSVYGSSQRFPTPCALEVEKDVDRWAEKRALPRSEKGGSHGPNLATAVKLKWPTPLASDANGVRAADGKRGVGLNTKVHWQTPVADDAVNRKDGKFNSRGEPKLSAQVKLWATPSARDWKDSPGMARSGINPDGSERKREDQLARQVYGEDAGGQLNPTWVEWLMGWPLLWTSTEPMPLETWGAWASAFQSEPTGCAASATGRCPQHSYWRGES